ncbi:MAG: hypothetical protein OEY58_18595, partial [Gammaproteobacteria bacterium]|nr:hypothetical protein [Gammaproteobacteria bacterium]
NNIIFAHVVCFLCRLFFSENNYTTKGTPPFLGAHTPEMIITPLQASKIGRYKIITQAKIILILVNTKIQKDFLLLFGSSTKYQTKFKQKANTIKEAITKLFSYKTQNNPD